MSRNKNIGDHIREHPFLSAVIMIAGNYYWRKHKRYRLNNPHEYEVLGILPAYSMTGFLVLPFFILSMLVPPLTIFLLPPALLGCYITSKVIYNKRKRRILAGG